MATLGHVIPDCQEEKLFTAAPWNAADVVSAVRHSEEGISSET